MNQQIKRTFYAYISESPLNKAERPASELISMLKKIKIDYENKKIM